MKIIVAGGTHLGIEGCYGRKEFEIENLGDLEEQIRRSQDLPMAKKSSYECGTKVIHTLTDERGATLFEYCVVEGDIVDKTTVCCCNCARPHKPSGQTDKFKVIRTWYVEAKDPIDAAEKTKNFDHVQIEINRVQGAVG